MGCTLKPSEAIQRVRPPPGRGAARQPEASLAWATATSLVKRRQRMLKPCVSPDIMCVRRPSAWVGPGQPRQDRQRRGSGGSAGVLEQGKAIGWIAKEPVRSRSRPQAAVPERDRRLNNGPGLVSALHAYQERLGEHEEGGSLWGLQPKP